MELLQILRSSVKIRPYSINPNGLLYRKTLNHIKSNQKNKAIYAIGGTSFQQSQQNSELISHTPTPAKGTRIRRKIPLSHNNRLQLFLAVIVQSHAQLMALIEFFTLLESIYFEIQQGITNFQNFQTESINLEK